MARRNRGIPKLEPVPLTLTFATVQGAPGAPVTSYIDISQAACLASRKFLRQGLNWAMAGMKITSLGSGTLSVYILPQTWVMSNSWHKSYATWTEMNDKALADSESVRPRFLDFKIYADAEHHAAGYAGNLLPQAPGGATVAGEWEPSKVIIPIGTASPGATADRELIAVGANYPGLGASGLDAVSLIEGYAASRGLPQVLDPNAPSDADDVTGFNPDNWMAAISNEGTDQTQDVLEDMISENNIAPYPFENDGTAVDTMYPGGANQMSGMQWHDFAQIYSTSATTNVGIARVKGGNVPCGLLKLVWTPSESNPNLVIQIDMVPGMHRGYLAEPMQDM